MSEGDFKWMTPFLPNKKPGDVDESTDTWDTIEWLLKNIPNNNGKIGVYGTSFPGHYAAQCLFDPHPALSAASPQAPMADNWLGDDMHHNGAFFLPHAMNFIAGFGKKRDGPTQNYGPRVFQHGTPDGYRFFLEMGPLKNANEKYLKNQIALWNEWISHPDYDEYWQAQNVPQHMKKVGNIPVLIVGGWWDAEDLYGPLAIYKAIEEFNPINNTSIVMGPWYHGTWNGGEGTSLHDIVWQTKTAVDFRENMQLPFFKYYLKGEGEKPNLPEAMMFDVGSDTWRAFEKWPPQNTVYYDLMFSKKETIIMQPSRGATGDWIVRLPQPFHEFDEFISDPNRPVPNSATITTGMARSYLIEDQRFVWTRPDVLSYETSVLQEDVTLAGPITATLYVSTTGTDADFIVKLIDVFPNNHPNNSPRGGNIPMGGYQMLIRGEPMRAKYRHSWSDPSPLSPGRIEKVEFVLPDVCYTFKKGHKIMVQIHGSWFPLIDRNPHKFLNIFEANEDDFQKATHRVFLSHDAQSRLRVNVFK